MSDRSFLDSNILVYTDDQDSPEKKEQALKLYSACRRRQQGVISTQVLQEYFVTVTRKLGVDAAIAKRKVELFGRLHLVTLRLDEILGAIDLYRLHRLSFWDALIIRAALISGCKRLYSEDLQHGRRIEGLDIMNPFTAG